MCEYIAYIMAISMQFTGSILLLIYFVSTDRKSVIKRFTGIGVIERCGEKISYNEEAFFNEFKSAYLNKAAFFCIVLGYILGVFGEVGERSRIYTVITVILISIMLILIVKYGIEFFVKHNQTTTQRITSKELDELGVQSHLNIASNDEFDEFLEETFGKNRK